MQIKLENIGIVKNSSIELNGLTVITGKNNSGKTTIVNALKMLCQNVQPSASDFNLSYLNELFSQYKNNLKKILLQSLKM